MQFGIFSHIPWPEGSDPKTLIDQMIAQAVYCEEQDTTVFGLQNITFHAMALARRL